MPLAAAPPDEQGPSIGGTGGRSPGARLSAAQRPPAVRFRPGEPSAQGGVKVAAGRDLSGRGALSCLSGLAGVGLIGSCLDELANPWKIIRDAERLAEMGVAAPIVAAALLTYIQVSVGILLLRPAIRSIFPPSDAAVATLGALAPGGAPFRPRDEAHAALSRWPLGGKVIDLDQHRAAQGPSRSSLP